MIPWGIVRTYGIQEYVINFYNLVHSFVIHLEVELRHLKLKNKKKIKKIK